ncbi:transcriptional regulator, LysR family [Candidatus Vecturithrix granuli]|uniref:Transcriptional regulator, LysR family n=1 Tax=Vecturithrix granuli TaxID=1499967 RepID=A0A081C9I2_VECG1|nr:transcriptional regulator, LysR family [Candidatus Vecturithrix granuli]
MELYQLRSFVAVAKEGHLTRATRRLFISQPAVSAHIKLLEEELGVTLFTRTPQGMQLTKEGQILKAQAETSLNAINELFQQAKRMQNELAGVIKIGLNADPEFLKIGDFFSVMAEQYPQLEFHLLQRPSWAVVEEIHTELLDIGYMFGEHSTPDIKATLLRTFNLLVIGPASWKDHLERATGWHDLAAFPWVWSCENCPQYKVLREIFHALHLTPSKVAVADDEATLKSLVASGAGLAILIEDDAVSAEQQGKVTIWRQNPLHLDLSCIYLRKREYDPVIQAALNGIFIVWNAENSLKRE